MVHQELASARANGEAGFLSWLKSPLDMCQQAPGWCDPRAGYGRPSGQNLSTEDSTDTSRALEEEESISFRRHFSRGSSMSTSTDSLGYDVGYYRRLSSSVRFQFQFLINDLRLARRVERNNSSERSSN